MDPTWSAKSSTKSSAKSSARSSARSSSDEDDDILVEPVPFKRVKQEHFDFWTDEHRFTLINEVSSYPELWDVKLPSYKDKQSSVFAWRKVVDSVNLAHTTSFEVGSARKQWKNLRDSFFKRHRTLQAMPTGSSTDDVPVKWKFYVPMQFLLRSVDTGRRMCNVGASTTSGISRSYRDVDLETNEARVVEFPPRKHSEASSSRDAAISQVCNTLQTLRSTRRQEDEHDGFGNFIACALRRMADIDMRRARTLRAKLLAVVQEEESSVVDFGL